MRPASIAALALFMLVQTVPALTQTQTSGPSKWRVQLGPLTMTPAVGLTNIGVDQNVFNEPADLHPQSDFTFTVTPKAGLELHVVRTLLTAHVNEDLVWYQTYASERSVNSTGELEWRVPLNRVSVTANVRGAHLRDRPGFEIDARSLRNEVGYGGILEVRVMPKTFVGVEASRQQVEYDKDAVFLNSSLRFELNRVDSMVGVSLRYALTPLTSVSLKATSTQDRFQFSSLRDASSRGVAGAITFDPLGVISGSATFGYVDFEPATPELRSLKSPTASVSLSTRFFSGTRIGVSAIRDVAYSYETTQPYYVQTGVGGSVVRALVGPVDVAANGDIRRLGYQDRVGVAAAASNRVDLVRTFGGGVGYRVGNGARLGFYVDRAHRSSDLLQREYDDVRFGATLTYGF